MVLANIAITIISTFLSTNNYPGGEVWRVLEDLQRGSNETVTIHCSTYPLQTGATLFTFIHSSPAPSSLLQAIPPPLEPTWVYSKSEDPDLATPGGAWDAGVDYLVTEAWAAYEAWRGDGGERWKLEQVVDGLEGVRRGGKWGIEVAWGRKIGILRRDAVR